MSVLELTGGFGSQIQPTMSNLNNGKTKKIELELNFNMITKKPLGNPNLIPIIIDFHWPFPFVYSAVTVLDTSGFI